MLTTVPSMNAMHDARIVAASVQRREGIGGGYQLPVTRLCAYDDVLGYRRGVGYRDAVFTKTFDVKLDRLIHVSLRLLPSGSGGDTSGEIGRIRREVCSGV